MKRYLGLPIIVGMLCCQAPFASAEETTAVAIGQRIDDLKFKDIRFLSRRLSEFGDQSAYVIICTNTTCPLVQRYLPKLKRLDEQYRGRGVQFVALNVGASDSIAEMAAQAIDMEADIPFVKDIDNQCVAALGVTRTPEAVVLDHQFILRYRGRIDDQYRIGGARPRVTSDDLSNAIESVLAGKEVAVAETEVDGCVITQPPLAQVADSVNFTDHVAPIVHKHCVECHRAGTAAPFALVQYEDVMQNGEMIAEVVADRRMPPWYAGPADKAFINYRGLSGQERDTILQWVREGMPRGAAVEQPEPPPVDTWLIGQPDKIIRTIETHTLPAEGYIPYKYALLPHKFTQDTWLQAIQIVADNPPVLHHCNLLGIPPSMKLNRAYFITGKVPGSEPLIVDNGVGILIPKGTTLALQIHYTTTGKPEKCRISVGLKYAAGKINKQFRHILVKSNTFAIPPGAPNHRVVAAETLDKKTTGIGLFTHMHLRGKDMTYYAHYPDGETQRLLTVPNYNFDWQMGYRWAPDTKHFPAGTRFECVAHFDNSTFNPFNPDPTATVKEGQQTYHEMMYGFYFYTEDDEALDLKIDPKTGHVRNATVDASGKRE